MIDKNKQYPIAKALRAHEKTGSLHPSTGRRWWEKGFRRKDGVVVHLGAEFIGGRLFTSLAAIDEFLTAINKETSQALATRSPAQRSKASEQAAAELIRKGA